MKRCFLTVTIIAAMMMSITACSTNNDNSSNAVSSKSSSSTSSSSSTPTSTPETKPEMRSYIKQKIDTWYSKHTDAQNANARAQEKYGDLSKIPDSEVNKAIAELQAVKNKIEEAQALLEELMGMKDLMNQTEIDYLGAILKKANG